MTKSIQDLEQEVLALTEKLATKDDEISAHEHTAEWSGATIRQLTLSDDNNRAVIKEQLKTILALQVQNERLREALIQRDGGTHDSDCKSLGKSKFCTCMHTETMRVLDETPAISLAAHNKAVILDAVKECKLIDADFDGVSFTINPTDMIALAEDKYGEGK